MECWYFCFVSDCFSAITVTKFPSSNPLILSALLKTIAMTKLLGKGQLTTPFLLLSVLALQSAHFSTLSTKCHHILTLIPVYGQNGGTGAGRCHGGLDAWSQSHGVAVCLIEGSHTSLSTALHEGSRQGLPEHTGMSRTVEPCGGRQERITNYRQRQNY